MKYDVIVLTTCYRCVNRFVSVVCQVACCGLVDVSSLLMFTRQCSFIGIVHQNEGFYGAAQTRTALREC